MRNITLSNAKIRPQPSERWVMYELVCPLVDLANQKSGLISYYELSVWPETHRRLSADVALVDDEDRRVWLIEAKKVKSRLKADFIKSYLSPGVMGAVTNGNRWIFQADGKSYDIGPLILPNGTMGKDAQDFIVSVLSCRTEETALRTLSALPENIIWRGTAKLPTVWHIDKGKGLKKFAEKSTFSSLREAIPAAMEHAKGSTKLFLQKLLEQKIEIPTGYLDVSNLRMVWRIHKGKRAARINLESAQLEILVLTEILNSLGLATILASRKLHDKNTEFTVCKASQLNEILSLIPVFSFQPKQ
jgi:hypothetical protein